MPPKRGRGRMPAKDPEPDALYRVFRTDNDRPAYLPAPNSNGLPQDEAQRLSDGLAVDTYIKKVWERPEAD